MAQQPAISPDILAALDLVESIRDWWKDAQSRTLDRDTNVFDGPPPFVDKAMAFVGDWDSDLTYVFQPGRNARFKDYAQQLFDAAATPSADNGSVGAFHARLAHATREELTLEENRGFLALRDDLLAAANTLALQKVAIKYWLRR